MRWMASMPSWCFPNQLIKLGMLMIFFDTVRYGNNYAYEDIGNVTKFYHGKSLTVGSKARGFYSLVTFLLLNFLIKHSYM